VQVTDSQAFETARYIARNLALLVGGSTGGAIFKALELIHKGVLTGNVVVPIADGGEKYLHTVFDEKWLQERDLIDPGIAPQLDAWLGKTQWLESFSAPLQLSVA
jgi:cystathionine beta-synthase